MGENGHFGRGAARLRGWGGAILLAALVAAGPGGAQEIVGTSLIDAATEEEAAALGAIPLVRPPDAEIAERLRGIFGSLDGLSGVDISVSNGVVRLTGTALTGEERQRAEDIARRLANVVEVDNRIVAEARVDRRLAPVAERARGLFRQTLAYLPLLLVSLLAWAFLWLVGWVLTRVLRPFRRVAPNSFIETLLGQVVRLGFLLAGLVVATNILGATGLLASVLGAAGVLGLAVGFAVRDTIENYIASILLSLRQPFAPGDFVEIEGHEGHIMRLNSRATMLMTLEGNEVRIPNATVYKTTITNFTSMPERRFGFEVGIGNENDLTCALALALRTLRLINGVLDRPEPSVVVDRFGDYAVILKAFGWVDQAHSNFFKVRSEAIRRIKEAFDAEGVTMPEPIQNVRPLSSPPAPAADGGVPAPTQDEVDAITDTRADPTIERKVDEVRRSSAPDLLARDAPRE